MARRLGLRIVEVHSGVLVNTVLVYSLFKGSHLVSSSKTFEVEDLSYFFLRLFCLMSTIVQAHTGVLLLLQVIMDNECGCILFKLSTNGEARRQTLK